MAERAVIAKPFNKSLISTRFQKSFCLIASQIFSRLLEYAWRSCYCKTFYFNEVSKKFDLIAPTTTCMYTQLLFTNPLFQWCQKVVCLFMSSWHKQINTVEIKGLSITETLSTLRWFIFSLLRLEYVWRSCHWQTLYFNKGFFWLSHKYSHIFSLTPGISYYSKSYIITSASWLAIKVNLRIPYHRHLIRYSFSQW